MNIRDYNFIEHNHRFALWTAARAVQRSFAKTESICKALESASLQQFVEEEIPRTRQQYDTFQSQWCNDIIEAFREMNISCSFGRAAKMVAIYLKTAVIMPCRGEGEICEVIHPPIDRILLTNLSSVEGLRSLRQIKWTQIDTMQDYHKVVNAIRLEGLPFNWKLEFFWQVNKATPE